MDTLPRFDELVALGRKLVEELGRNPRVDTLSRWMAHYIAELVDAAENGPQKRRAAARRQCFEAILELWSYRAELPGGRRPFEKLEPVARALESLDPDNDTPRYFRGVRSAMAQEDEATRNRDVLEFVDSVDCAARVVIGVALADAARSAIDKAKEWVALAERAEVDAGFVDSVVSFASGGAGNENQSDQDEREREQLRRRVQQLEAFRKLAAAVADCLNRRLDGLSRPAESSGDIAKDERAERARA